MISGGGEDTLVAGYRFKVKGYEELMIAE